MNESFEGESFTIDFNKPKSFEDSELDRPYYVNDRKDNGVFKFEEITINCKGGNTVKFPQTNLGPFTLAVRSVPV